MRYTYRRSGAVALAIGVLGAAACSRSEGAATPEEDAGVRVVNVEVTPVRLTSFTDYIRVTGEVEALYDITLSAEEPGVIERFLVPKGAAVRRGQVIVEFDSDVLAAQVREARAGAELAREEFERQRLLWEDEQIGSEIVYLRTRSAAAVAAARLATLEARLDRTKIRAPVAGIFDEKLMEVGERAAAGDPIIRVVAVRRVKIVGGVPERLAAAVRPGQLAQVSFDILPGRQFEGRIGFVGSSVDRTNRTVPIEVVMDNPEGAAKPGMIAAVQVVREQRDSAVVVPQQVVQRTEDGYQVFVAVERDGSTVAEARAVVLGPSYRNQVVIESGLDVGDRLITLGGQLVDSGSRVRIVNASAIGADAGKDPE